VAPDLPANDEGSAKGKKGKNAETA